MASNDKMALEGGVEFLARLSRDVTGIAHSEGYVFSLRFGKVIEVTGESGSGKTQFLLNIIAQAVLPTHYDDVTIGGSNAEVLLVTCFSGINILRLISILESRIMTAKVESGFSDTQTSEIVEKCIEDCLRRLHIYNCTDFIQLTATLLSLDNVIMEKRIRILILETNLVFPWPNDMENGDEANKCAIIRMLKILSERYQLSTFVTNTEVVPVTKNHVKELIKVFNSKVAKQFDGKIHCSMHGNSIKLVSTDGKCESLFINQAGCLVSNSSLGS